MSIDTIKDQGAHIIARIAGWETADPKDIPVLIKPVGYAAYEYEVPLWVDFGKDGRPYIQIIEEALKANEFDDLGRGILEGQKVQLLFEFDVSRPRILIAHLQINE